MKNTVRQIGLSLLVAVALQSPAAAQFIENKGQWPESVHYRLTLGAATYWFEQSGWKMTVMDEDALTHAHPAHDDTATHSHEAFSDLEIMGHNLFVQFPGSQASQPQGRQEVKAKFNFFIGNDRSKWAGGARGFSELIYPGLYQGIDAVLTLASGCLKITYVVAPMASADALRFAYAGHRGLEVNGQDLRIATSVQAIEERGLEVFQIANSKSEIVHSTFNVFPDNTVGFTLGTYDPALPLYIDPTIIASTNSGSTTTNYGHTATFDNPGNIYAAGRAFGNGYPTDTGSFQMNIAVGVDMCISKYNPDGSQLLYATYLGGSGQDLPHSMIVDAQGQLHVMGTTASLNFPISTNAFDTSNNGNYDMTVTIFNSMGSDIIGSTYVGGSGNDGTNNIIGNYGDNFRGEIITDGFGNVYVANCSDSPDFPTTEGVFQDTLAGQQDGVVFKLNYNLSQLLWSTYIGGAGMDIAYGIKLDDTLDLYISGSTQGQGFPEDSLGAHPTYLGGDYDGYVLKLAQGGTSVLHASYFGTSQKDQNYFVQLDRYDNVYLFGQSNGGIASTAGKYQGPQLGTYIYKTTPTLDTIEWVSAFGNMSPTAFLVDLCNNIYVCGQGALGTLSTTNFDTLNAVLPVGSAGFYLMSLTPDGSTLEFGSFFGNIGSHVDGGTSRFDKRGYVYAATCSSGAFTTTNWAYSPGNMAGGSYDVTAFKIDFGVNGVVAYAATENGYVGCQPFEVHFTNEGSIGDVDFWEFGDGITSSDSMPIHTYDTAGVYKVMYVKSDSMSCNLADTDYLYITVLDTASAHIQQLDSSCADSVAVIVETNYSNILWSTGQMTNTIWLDSNTTVWVEVSNVCGVFTDTLDVEVLHPVQFSLPNDTGICEDSLVIHAPSGPYTYLWSNGHTGQDLSVMQTGSYALTVSNGFCDDADTVNVFVSYIGLDDLDTVVCEDAVRFGVLPGSTSVLWSTDETTDTISVSNTGNYWVKVGNQYCEKTDTFHVVVAPISLALPMDTVTCNPVTIDATREDYTAYLWSDSTTTPTITIADSGVVWLQVTNGFCDAVDSILISAVEYANIGHRSLLLCDKTAEKLTVNPITEAAFLWSTGDTTDMIYAIGTGTYNVSITKNGCRWMDTFDLVFAQTPVIRGVGDAQICMGELLRLEVDSLGERFLWSTGDTGLITHIGDSGTHWLRVANQHCDAVQDFKVSYVQGEVANPIFFPNVLTPNFDGLNESVVLDMKKYTSYYEWQVKIYNRWGVKIFESEEPYIEWKAVNRNDVMVDEGVYYYIITAKTYCLTKPEVTYQGVVHIMK